MNDATIRLITSVTDRGLRGPSLQAQHFLDFPLNLGGCQKRSGRCPATYINMHALASLFTDSAGDGIGDSCQTTLLATSATVLRREVLRREV